MKPNTHIEDYIDDKVVVKAYGYSENRLIELDKDNSEIIAKHIRTENPSLKSDRYFLLIGQDNTLYNPSEVNQRGLQDKIAARPFWNWTNVSYSAFDMYLTYLRTHNKHYYRTAIKQISMGE